MPEGPQSTIDVDRLALPVGGGRRIDLLVDPGEVTSGGTTYVAVERLLAARLEISRTVSGYAFRLTFGADLEGPCVSCLEPAAQRIEVDSREVHQANADDEELESPYVEDGILRIADWARDALLLAMPERFLCRPDCAGLCPVCGESLNDSSPEEHQHETEPDPRWAKLRELQQGMRDEKFLSPAGKRFVLFAAVLIIGGLIAYYAISDEVSFDFLEDLDEIGQQETSTTSTTFDVPEFEVPEVEIPGPPPSAQNQIQQAEKIFDCIERADGDVDKISACANQ